MKTFGFNVLTLVLALVETYCDFTLMFPFTKYVLVYFLTNCLSNFPVADCLPLYCLRSWVPDLAAPASPLPTTENFSAIFMAVLMFSIFLDLYNEITSASPSLYLGFGTML